MSKLAHLTLFGSLSPGTCERGDALISQVVQGPDLAPLLSVLGQIPAPGKCPGGLLALRVPRGRHVVEASLEEHPAPSLFESLPADPLEWRKVALTPADWHAAQPRGLKPRHVVKEFGVCAGQLDARPPLPPSVPLPSFLPAPPFLHLSADS